jgi:3-oxoacyl-[acyl-carrier protein] reductase
MEIERPRHVLVSGASRGLGEAIARHCLARGDLVTTCARSPTSIRDCQRHRHHIVDVQDANAIDELFAHIRDEAKYLDVLINNAGVASMNALALTPAETVQRIVRTNVEATILASRAGIRLLRGSGAGRIVNVSTVAVPLRLAGEAVYAASKSAVETFTRVIAKEFAQFGVTCNAVGPSPIATDLTMSVPPEKIDRLLRSQAVSRWATPDDVINVIEFFLSPASHMITGQVVYLGGAG